MSSTADHRRNSAPNYSSYYEQKVAERDQQKKRLSPFATQGNGRLFLRDCAIHRSACSYWGYPNAFTTRIRVSTRITNVCHPTSAGCLLHYFLLEVLHSLFTEIVSNPL